MFVRVKRRDGVSTTRFGEDDTPRFPLSWTGDSIAITKFDFDYLTITKKEVAHYLDEFFYHEL